MKNNFSPEFMKSMIRSATVTPMSGEIRLGLLKVMAIYMDESFPDKLAPTYIIKVANACHVKIKAICAIRRHTGMGLKEAKDIIDATEFQDQIAFQTSDAKLARNLHADLVEAGATSWVLEIEAEILS